MGGFSKGVDGATGWVTDKAGFPDAIPKLSGENNWVKSGVLVATAAVTVAALWYPVKWICNMITGDAKKGTCSTCATPHTKAACMGTGHSPKYWKADKKPTGTTGTVKTTGVRFAEPKVTKETFKQKWAKT